MSEPAAADRCPRCGGEFRCGVTDAQPCACTTIRLGERALAELRERYTGCLCMRCLVELSAAPEQGTHAHQ